MHICLRFSSNNVDNLGCILHLKTDSTSATELNKALTLIYITLPFLDLKRMKVEKE